MAAPIHALDHTLTDANVWIKVLADKLHIDDDHLAYAALRASLHTLRDRLPPSVAVHLGAQLPTLIRGIYYEGWRMGQTPTRARYKAGLLDHVQRELGPYRPVLPEEALRATFDLLWDKIDPAEIAKIIEEFPKELRSLWPRLAQYG